jgi:hypothetical protein
MARTYYYYKIFRKTLIQFLDMLNEIYVARYDNDGNITKTVLVPVKFGPKEKAYYWVKEYSTEEQLPIISVTLMSIDYDSTRLGNKNVDIVVSKDYEQATQEIVKNLVPYNFLLNVNIWALHIVDIDQILEQILPFFNPFTMIRIGVPELDANIELKVVFNSATPDIMEDWGEEDWRVLKWTLTFTIQGYFILPISEEGVAGNKLIEKAMARIYTTKGAMETETETTFTSGASGNYAEAVYVEALGYDETAGILSRYEIFPGRGIWDP